MKVLIVDDEVDLVEVFEMMLQRKGYETTKAYSGFEGLEAMRNDQFDLILSDIRMPKCDGIQFFSILKEEFDDLPPFIFMTGFSEVSEGEILKMGARELLKKPIEMAKLLATLEKYKK